jgi:F-type H+-transporting ATPase subunit a
MEGFDHLNNEYWQPLAAFGFTNSFFNINKETIILTWVLLAGLFALCLPVRFFLRPKFPLARDMVVAFVKWFTNVCTQTLGTFYFNHFAFVTALFMFIFGSSLLALVPGMDEPTKDINTTLALGIISFMYIQIYTIKRFGWAEYIKKEYLSPLLMLPLHVIGKFATIISISFRLFGNIFGGSTISTIYASAAQSHWLAQALTLGTGLNLAIAIFFGIFEGFLQAFVFAMLTLTYLSIALEDESETDGAHE